MAPDSACAQQFHSMQQMAQQGGQSGLVRLDFVNAPGRVALYAHEAYLMTASGVLRDLLANDEDADSDTAGPQAKVARTSDSSDAKAARLRAIVPLHDDSATAWEDALSLLYPSTMLAAAVTWDNAEQLLLLADRYDMPCITEKVKRFMSAGIAGNSRLNCCLTAEEAFRWLTVFSRCGLDAQASICINYITQNNLQLPADYLGSSGLHHKHLEELYNTMQRHSHQQVSGLQQQLSQAQDKLKQSLQPCPRWSCIQCNAPWYQRYGYGRPEVAAPNCVRCGADRRTDCGYLPESDLELVSDSESASESGSEDEVSEYEDDSEGDVDVGDVLGHLASDSEGGEDLQDGSDSEEQGSSGDEDSSEDDEDDSDDDADDF